MKQSMDEEKTVTKIRSIHKSKEEAHLPSAKNTHMGKARMNSGLSEEGMI